jgi:hypothetical protein
MAATGALSTPQFGSVSDGTYDIAANAAFNEEHFRPVRQRQFAQIKSQHTSDMVKATTARQSGDRAGAARALTQAAASRRMVEGWAHLKR